MRKIIVVNYMTMDGVLQSPGSAEEDRTGGFKWGGWISPHWDDMMDGVLTKLMGTEFDLLLGRRTYEIFVAHWPYQKDPISEVFNRINKYVVATTPVELTWENSILINKNAVEELKKLKAADGPNLLIYGSSRLIQTLLSHGLIDELHAWIFPITLGEGKKLFDDGTRAQKWKLTNSVTTKTGVILASYVPDGDVKLADIESEAPSAAELARRKKWNKT